MIISKIQEYCIYFFPVNICQFVWSILDISPIFLFFLKTFTSEFSYVEVWFTDQNFKRLDIEDKINITLVIN